MPMWTWRSSVRIRAWLASGPGSRMWRGSKKKPMALRARSCRRGGKAFWSERQLGLSKAEDDASKLLSSAPEASAAGCGYGFDWKFGRAGAPAAAAHWNAQAAQSL